MKSIWKLMLFGLAIEMLLVIYRLAPTEPAPTVIKYMIVFALVFVVMMTGYRMLRGMTFGKKELFTVLLFALVFQLTLLPEAPEMSDDIYRYIWDGKMQAHGINPFRYAPDDPALEPFHSDMLPRLVNFPEIKTIYPPVSQMVFYLSYSLFGESVRGLKFLFVLFAMGAAGLFYLLLRERGLDPVLLLFFAWNPLVIMETVVNGHLDVVMVFFVLAAFLFYYRGRYALTGIALAMGVLSKLIPVVLLPIFIGELFSEPTEHTEDTDKKKRFFSHGRTRTNTDKKQKFFRGPGGAHHGWALLAPRAAGQKCPPGHRRHVFMLLTPFILTISLAYAQHGIWAANMFKTALNYSSKWYFNNPIFHGIHFLAGSNETAHLVSFSLFCVVFVVLFFSGLEFEKKIFYVALAFVLLNPTLHPWYLILLVGLVCVYPVKSVVWWSGLVVVSYVVVYGFKMTGVWEDSWFQLMIQYIPLTILFRQNLATKAPRHQEKNV